MFEHKTKKIHMECAQTLEAWSLNSQITISMIPWKQYLRGEPVDLVETLGLQRKITRLKKL
jgi:hypothetical protein